MSNKIKYYQSNQIWILFPYILCDKKSKDENPWREFVETLEYFNRKRKNTITDYIWKVLEELMSIYFPQTTRTGFLHSISYTGSNPKPICTQFNNIRCEITGIILSIDIKRGDYNELQLRFTNLNATTDC